jgi:hypothetical protein
MDPRTKVAHLAIYAHYCKKKDDESYLSYRQFFKLTDEEERTDLFPVLLAHHAGSPDSDAVSIRSTCEWIDSIPKTLETKKFSIPPSPNVTEELLRATFSESGCSGDVRVEFSKSGTSVTVTGNPAYVYGSLLLNHYSRVYKTLVNFHECLKGLRSRKPGSWKTIALRTIGESMTKSPPNSRIQIPLKIKKRMVQKFSSEFTKTGFATKYGIESGLWEMPPSVFRVLGQHYATIASNTETITLTEPPVPTHLVLRLTQPKKVPKIFQESEGPDPSPPRNVPLKEVDVDGLLKDFPMPAGSRRSMKRLYRSQMEKANAYEDSAGMLWEVLRNEFDASPERLSEMRKWFDAISHCTLEWNEINDAFDEKSIVACSIMEHAGNKIGEIMRSIVEDKHGPEVAAQAFPEGDHYSVIDSMLELFFTKLDVVLTEKVVKSSYERGVKKSSGKSDLPNVGGDIEDEEPDFSEGGLERLLGNPFVVLGSVTFDSANVAIDEFAARFLRGMEDHGVITKDECAWFTKLFDRSGVILSSREYHSSSKHGKKKTKIESVQAKDSDYEDSDEEGEDEEDDGGPESEEEEEARPTTWKDWAKTLYKASLMAIALGLLGGIGIFSLTTLNPNLYIRSLDQFVTDLNRFYEFVLTDPYVKEMMKDQSVNWVDKETGVINMERIHVGLLCAVRNRQDVISKTGEQLSKAKDEADKAYAGFTKSITSLKNNDRDMIDWSKQQKVCDDLKRAFPVLNVTQIPSEVLDSRITAYIEKNKLQIAPGEIPKLTAFEVKQMFEEVSNSSSTVSLVQKNLSNLARSTVNSAVLQTSLGADIAALIPPSSTDPSNQPPSDLMTVEKKTFLKEWLTIAGSIPTFSTLGKSDEEIQKMFHEWQESGRRDVMELKDKIFGRDFKMTPEQEMSYRSAVEAVGNFRVRDETYMPLVEHLQLHAYTSTKIMEEQSNLIKTGQRIVGTTGIDGLDSAADSVERLRDASQSYAGFVKENRTRVEEEWRVKTVKDRMKNYMEPIQSGKLDNLSGDACTTMAMTTEERADAETMRAVGDKEKMLNVTYTGYARLTMRDIASHFTGSSGTAIADCIFALMGLSALESCENMLREIFGGGLLRSGVYGHISEGGFTVFFSSVFRTIGVAAAGFTALGYLQMGLSIAEFIGHSVESWYSAKKKYNEVRLGKLMKKYENVRDQSEWLPGDKKSRRTWKDLHDVAAWNKKMTHLITGYITKGGKIYSGILTVAVLGYVGYGAVFSLFGLGSIILTIIRSYQWTLMTLGGSGLGAMWYMHISPAAFSDMTVRVGTEIIIPIVKRFAAWLMSNPQYRPVVDAIARSPVGDGILHPGGQPGPSTVNNGDARMYTGGMFYSVKKWLTDNLIDPVTVYAKWYYVMEKQKIVEASLYITEQYIKIDAVLFRRSEMQLGEDGGAKPRPDSFGAFLRISLRDHMLRTFGGKKDAVEKRILEKYGNMEYLAVFMVTHSILYRMARAGFRTVINTGKVYQWAVDNLIVPLSKPLIALDDLYGFGKGREKYYQDTETARIFMETNVREKLAEAENNFVKTPSPELPVGIDYFKNYEDRWYNDLLLLMENSLIREKLPEHMKHLERIKAVVTNITVPAWLTKDVDMDLNVLDKNR